METIAVIADGPGDEIVGLENDLGAAIEVTLDQEVKVLYPQKSCSFNITRASDKLMKVHCRDDSSIFATQQVEDSTTLRASESFGSFGVEVSDFLQKEQQQVEREKSLLQERKRKMEEELEKAGRGITHCRVGFMFILMALCVGELVLCTYLLITVVEDEFSAAVLSGCLGMLVFGLALSGFVAQLYGKDCPGSRMKKLVHSVSIGCCVLGSLAATIAIGMLMMAGFWWAVVTAGFACCGCSAFRCSISACWSRDCKRSMENAETNAINQTMVFHSKVLPGTGACSICSCPGKYESAWDELVAGSRSKISAAEVFLPKCPKHFSHDVIPKGEKLQGSCWKPWSCRWSTKWIEDIESAHSQGPETEVYFFKGMKPRGKADDFSPAGEEHLMREAIQDKQDFLQSQVFSDALEEGIEGLSKDSFAGGTETHFGVASRGRTPLHGGI